MLNKGVFYCSLSYFLRPSFSLSRKLLDSTTIAGSQVLGILLSLFCHRHLPLCLAFYVGAKAQTQILILM